MIRIFITAILYLITMFTQAQERPSIKSDSVVGSTINQVDESCKSDAKMERVDFCRFDDAKFEVNDKDLTFDRR